MVQRTPIDWLKLCIAAGVATLLCACTSAIVSSTPVINQARYVGVPDEDYRLLMPPTAMQDKISALIESGKAPGYLVMPQAVINEICGRRLDHVLGCVYESKVGKTIFITNAVRGEARKMLLMHEYAHYLLGWRHS